jgi:hypothetical protein
MYKGPPVENSREETPKKPKKVFHLLNSNDFFLTQTIQDKQDNKNPQRFQIKGFPYIKTKYP